MLTWSAIVLTGAVLGGLVLVALSQAASPSWRRWPGWLHGAAGLAGLALLLAGLGGPARGVQQGAGSFGLIAAGFVGAAAILGALVFAARLRQRSPSTLAIGVHATLAVGGLVMLAAYLSA